MGVETDLLTGALREVFDPEYPISLVDLGLIRGAELDGTTAKIRLTYTCMGCPAMEMIQDDIEKGMYYGAALRVGRGGEQIFNEDIGYGYAGQKTPLDKVQFLAGPEGARHGLAQEWDKYDRFLEWISKDRRWPVLDAARDALRARWPKNQPEGLVWGDARLSNMMFDENFEVLAVMDWEQPSLGGALQDLAWFCTLAETMHGRNSQMGAWLEGMGSREETIALWEEITGKSAADLEWYEDFTQLKMSCTGVRLDMLRGTEMVKPEYIAQRLKVG